MKAILKTDNKTLEMGIEDNDNSLENVWSNLLMPLLKAWGYSEIELKNFHTKFNQPVKIEHGTTESTAE